MSGAKPVACSILGMLLCLDCGQNAARLVTKNLFAEDMPGDHLVLCSGCGTPVWPEPCAFCEIANGRAEAEWILRPDFWPETVAFVPLEPLTEGHCLIAPKQHVQNFAADPEAFSTTARRAAELMRWSIRPMNLLTNMGAEAGQSVMHLHLHLIPREAGDGIRLLTRRKK